MSRGPYQKNTSRMMPHWQREEMRVAAQHPQTERTCTVCNARISRFSTEEMDRCWTHRKNNKVKGPTCPATQ